MSKNRIIKPIQSDQDQQRKLPNQLTTWEKKELAEMAECTFQPKISAAKPYALLEHQAAQQSFVAPNLSSMGASSLKPLPKSYEKEIQRIRQANL